MIGDVIAITLCLIFLLAVWRIEVKGRGDDAEFLHLENKPIVSRSEHEITG